MAAIAGFEDIARMLPDVGGILALPITDEPIADIPMEEDPMPPPIC